MPKFSLSLTQSQKKIFKDNTKAYELLIKLIHLNKYATSASINIIYNIKLELFKKNNENVPRSRADINCDFQQPILRQMATIDTKIENLHVGLYTIEIQPLVNSSVCKELCPYEVSNNGRLDEDRSIIGCKPCKKFNYLLWIDNDSSGGEYIQPKATFEIDNIPKEIEILNYDIKTNIEGIFTFNAKSKVNKPISNLISSSIMTNRFLINQSSLCVAGERFEQATYQWQIVLSVLTVCSITSLIGFLIFYKLKSKQFKYLINII